MSARAKVLHINNELTYKIIIETPRKKKRFSYVSEKYVHKLKAFLEKYGQSASTPWKELAASRITKYKKTGLVLKGARYREGFSQKDLAKRTGISQENISRMENGQRSIGEKVAKKLAKALRIDFALLIGAA